MQKKGVALTVYRERGGTGTRTFLEGLGAAMERHRAGRLGEAEALYLQVLHMCPQSPEALHLLGVLSYQVGRPDAAVDYIGMAVEVCPEYPEAYNSLGVVLQGKGQKDAAMDCYQFAGYLKPDLVEAHYNLGNLLEERGELEGAASCFIRAHSLRMRYPVTWAGSKKGPGGVFCLAEMETAP